MENFLLSIHVLKELFSFLFLKRRLLGNKLGPPFLRIFLSFSLSSTQLSLASLSSNWDSETFDWMMLSLMELPSL